MDYPSRLLPQPNYRIIDFDNAHLQARFLIRHTKNQDVWENNRLRPEHVPVETKHIWDFSTNLLGEFTPEDICWEWLNPTIWQNIWQTQTEPFIPTFEKDVTIAHGRGSYYLHSKEIHKKTFNDTNEHDEALKIECRILHTPNLSNFWHCSLRWRCNDHESDQWINWAKPIRKRIVRHIAHFIIDHAETTPNYQAIDPQDYH